MKKLSLLAFLLFVSVAFSQEQKEKDELPKMNVYIGFGYNFNDSYSIDSKLARSGIPAVSKNTPELILGWSAYDKQFFMDFESTISFIKKNSNSDVTTVKST